MTHVSKIFDPALLQEEIDAGYIRVQSHPTLPLKIYNYTELAQFSRRFNDVTMNCRGLILDDDLNIVARPWKRFLNYGEGPVVIDSTMPVEVVSKEDGSLGILWTYDEDWGIATRGSFTSDQAIHATQVFRDRYYNKINWPATDDTTFLFEIVYPANQIVVNYSGLDDLILLGAVNNEYGYYHGPIEAEGLLAWPGPIAKIFPYKNLMEVFAAPHIPNAEGFVIRSGQAMTKYKFPSYVELHRIVTNLNERTIWQHILDGGTVEQLIEKIPDEFHGFVQRVVNELNDKCQEICDAVMSEYYTCMNMSAGGGRKEFARFATKRKNSGYLFMLYDNRPIWSEVYRSLRPRTEHYEKV